MRKRGRSYKTPKNPAIADLAGALLLAGIVGMLKASNKKKK